MGGLADESARVVQQFKEKPDPATARAYLDAGAQCYLWNSGMFVWRAATLIDCIRRYAPENLAGLEKIADAWSSPEKEAVLAAVFPALKKISVDFAIMEPASRDPAGARGRRADAIAVARCRLLAGIRRDLPA